jgi:hypothetical protein
MRAFSVLAVLLVAASAFAAEPRVTLLAHPHRPRPASPEPGPAAGPAFPWVFAFWVCGGLPGRNGPGAQTGNDG